MSCGKPNGVKKNSIASIATLSSLMLSPANPTAAKYVMKQVYVITFLVKSLSVMLFPGDHKVRNSASNDDAYPIPCRIPDDSCIVVLVRRQCVYAVTSRLMLADMSAHQNLDSIRNSVCHAPMCLVIGDAWHAENFAIRSLGGTPLKCI